jgi:adenylate cyclase
MESAWRAAGEAMALNPFDTEVLADVGARHVQSGHYEKGLGMLQQALELNPSPPTWALTFRATALYLLGRLDQSVPAVTALRGTEYPPAMMAVIMVARQSREAVVAKQALADMMRLHPGIMNDPAAYLKRLAFDQETITRIVKDFQIAKDWAAQLP